MFHSQLMLCLLESVYLLDLVQLRLDEKALSLLTILSPFLFIIFLGISDHSIARWNTNIKLVSGLLTIVLRVVAFWLPTPILKLIFAALGVGSFWIYLPATIGSITKKSANRASLMMGLGVALASLILTLLRTIDNTRDISSLPGKWNAIGAGLGGLACVALVSTYISDSRKAARKDLETLNKKKHHSHPVITFLRTFGLTTSMVLIVMTLYIVYESPAVLTRWTGGSYLFVIVSVSAVVDTFLTLLVIIPRVILRLNRAILFLWNFLFSLMFLFTMISQRVHFPEEPSDEAVEFSPEMRGPQYLVLCLNIILHPVLFVDIILITKHLVKIRPSNTTLGISFALSNVIGLGILAMHLFSNIWGYVGAISKVFRNGFYIPFVVVCFFLIVLVGLMDSKWLLHCLRGGKKKDRKKRHEDFDNYVSTYTDIPKRKDKKKDITSGFTTDVPTDFEHDGWTDDVHLERSYDEFANTRLHDDDIDNTNSGGDNTSLINNTYRKRTTTHWSKKAKGLVILLFFAVTLATIVLCILSESHPISNKDLPTPKTLTVLQYNIQQGLKLEDGIMYRKVDEQLEFIKKLNPDIIGLEKCDTTRAWLNNFDVVRFFANTLDYYSFYGPKTTSGTFGVCVLSRYPISDETIVYTYADLDDVAIVRVTIDVKDFANLTLFVSDPDGSDVVFDVYTSEIVHQVSELLNTTKKVIYLSDLDRNATSTHYKQLEEKLFNPWYEKYPTGVDSSGLDMTGAVDFILLDDTWKDRVLNVTYVPAPHSFSDHPALFTILSLE